MNFNNTLSFPSLLLPLPVSLFITPSLPPFLSPSLFSFPLSAASRSFPAFLPLSSDMVYGDSMSLGTNVGEGKEKGKTPIPLWDKMDREAWKKQIYYSLQRWFSTTLFIFKFLFSINYCVSISYSIFIIYYLSCVPTTKVKNLLHTMSNIVFFGWEILILSTCLKINLFWINLTI